MLRSAWSLDHTAALHIEVLGGFTARTESGSTVSLGTRKAQALLAYLALTPGRVHARTSLYALLWGDHEDEQARGSLRYALTDIRKGLGEHHPVLCTERDVVYLKPDAVIVDAVEFERLTRSDIPAAVKQAVSLYRGDLLGGMAIRAPTFEEWLSVERERLRNLAIQSLCRQLDAQPDPDMAHCLLGLDPLSEAAHRALMRHYAQSGQWGLAIRQYETCVAALERELGVRPEAETCHLRDRILQRRIGSEETHRSPTRGDTLITDRPSVRIMPFGSVGEVGDLASLASGLGDAIATELARFRDVTVFRSNYADEAQFELDGTVQRLGSHLRLATRLVERKTGWQIWSERYDRAAEDLFMIQDELMATIATTVVSRLTMLVYERAQRRPPQDLHAYECFVQGNRCIDRLDPEAREQARLWFEKALAIDPTFARAHNGMAFVHVQNSNDNVGVTSSLGLDTALQHAEAALDLDPADPRVQYTLAYVCLHRREFERARRHYVRAVELNPNDPIILAHWGLAQAYLGEAEAGLRTLQSALPRMLSPPRWYFTYCARALLLAHRPVESAWQMASLGRLDGPRDLAWYTIACAHAGRAKEASRLAADFVEAARAAWRGDKGAWPAEFGSWFLDATLLARREDCEYLRLGLRDAGLPV
ncbi:BTAD domain-containing putative transcriptional regulator [Mesorhizobium sp.]|uniref:BTAD domain-containing putative transcriptional regulator n=1 Tax=Mesorhizobium sp. TaxID=1871066 RepID=UPI0025F5F81D|nr:BTAD domain-containing putative transcriptional regulator [Mesorhizobium sp.]